MIYFIDIEKQEAFNDGTPRDDGIFLMKEHWNMSTVATFTSRKMCEHVIKLLNEESQKLVNDHNMQRFNPEI